MRKLSCLLVVVATLLAGCFETTEEITLNEDGSGRLTYTTDLSNIFSMMGQMASGKEMDKAKNMDTTISFSKFADSIKDITAQEKALMKNGTLRMMLNMKDEKFLNVISFPFKKIEELKILKQALPKAGSEALKKLASRQSADLPPGMSMDDIAKTKSFDDFFDVNMSSTSFSRMMNKTKYSAAETDEYMKGLQQMNAMGVPMTANYVFNLPRPAKKTEGKGLKLSADKKKVSLTVTSEDFFDEPKKFEYKIEY